MFPWHQPSRAEIQLPLEIRYKVKKKWRHRKCAAGALLFQGDLAVVPRVHLIQDLVDGKLLPGRIPVHRMSEEAPNFRMAAQQAALEYLGIEIDLEAWTLCERLSGKDRRVHIFYVRLDDPMNRANIRYRPGGPKSTATMSVTVPHSLWSTDTLRQEAFEDATNGLEEVVRSGSETRSSGSEHSSSGQRGALAKVKCARIRV